MPSKFRRLSYFSLCVFGFLYPACSSSGDHSTSETSGESSSNSSGDQLDIEDSTSSSDASASGETESGNSSSGSEVGSDSSSASSSGSSSATSSGSESESGSETGSETGTETGSDDSNSESSEESDTGSLKKNGEICGSDGECESDQCNMAFPGQGICSECVDDAACRESGKGLNCIVGTATEPWFVCGEGKTGESCMSDEGCMSGLSCGDVFGQKKCSECSNDEDCTENDRTLCVLIASLFPSPAAPAPYLACKKPGSLKNSRLCNLETNGEEACQQHCTEFPANFPAPPGFGLCGECRDDMDCEEGESCKDIELMLQKVKGTTCEEISSTTGETTESTGDTTGHTTEDTGGTTADSGTGSSDSGDSTTGS